MTNDCKLSRWERIEFNEAANNAGDPYLAFVARNEPEPSGERKLLLAILARAILDFHNVAMCNESDNRLRAGRTKQIQDDAKAWIASDTTEPYSFRWICAELRQDYQAARERIPNLNPRVLLDPSRAKMPMRLSLSPYYDGASPAVIRGRVDRYKARMRLTPEAA